MSTKRKNALRPMIDAKTAEYIDAAIAEAVTHLVGEIDKQRRANLTLESKNATLMAQIADLQVRLNETQQDDKYVLTKAKLVRFMKEHGIL